MRRFAQRIDEHHQMAAYALTLLGNGLALWALLFTIVLGIIGVTVSLLLGVLGILL